MCISICIALGSFIYGYISDSQQSQFGSGHKDPATWMEPFALGRFNGATDTTEHYENYCDYPLGVYRSDGTACFTYPYIGPCRIYDIPRRQ